MTVLAEKKEMIKQFSGQSPCMCFNIQKASRVITSIYDGLFKNVGITAVQGAILGSLRVIGCMTVNELSEAVAKDRTTINRNLKPLERDGLIAKCSGEDKREKEISITAKGIKKVEASHKVWQEFQAKVNADIGKEKIEQLCHDLCDTLTKLKNI